MKFRLPAGLLLLFLSIPAQAQDRQEGFEKEKIQGITYPHWERVIDSTHPTYNEVLIVDDPGNARTGKSFLRLQTHGGDTSFQEYLRDATSVAPGQVYLVSAYARMKTAGPGERQRTNVASVQLRWLGKRGEPLRVDNSIPVTGVVEWTPLSLEVQTPPKNAKWVQIRLSFRGRDVRGECDFDDVRLQIRPRITVRPKDRILPVFLRGEDPKFLIEVPSIRTSGVILEATVRNQRGDVAVPTESIPIVPGKDIQQKVPSLGNSYQELHLQLRRGGKILTTKIVPILFPELPVFGTDTVAAAGLTFNPFHENYSGMRQLAKLLHLRNAKMVVWDHPAAQRSKEPPPAEILRLIRDATSEAETSFIGVLAQPLPSAFPQRNSGGLRGSPLLLFHQEKTTWAPILQDLIRRYREVIRQWQIGFEYDPTASDITGKDRLLGKAIEPIRKVQKSSIIGTALPRREIENAPLKNAQFYAASTTDWRTPEEFETPVTPPGTIVYRSASLQAAPPLGGTAARRLQAADFLKKMIFNAASGNPNPLFFPVTSGSQGGILDSDGFPTATALAMRVANDLLSGATHRKNEHIFAPPLRDFVFEKNGKWFVAFWSEKGSHTLSTFLGHNAQLWDPLGTRAPFGSPGRARVDDLPLFITDIDPYLLKTILTLKFHPEKPGEPEDSTLPMRADPIVKRLRMTNHFPTELVGLRIRIVPPFPKEWDIRPREMRTSRLGKEMSLETPVTFRLPQTEREGVRKLRINVTFFREDDRNRPFTINTARALQVVPQILIKETVTPVGGNPNRKRVRIRIENKTGRTLNLRGSLRVPGRADRPVLIGAFQQNSNYDLDPVVVDSRAEFRGQGVEVQLYEMGGKRIFANKIIKLGP